MSAPNSVLGSSRCHFHAEEYLSCLGADHVRVDRIADMDREFKKQVSKMAESVTACFICGSCSAVCPETLFDANNDPRRFIRKVNMGLRDEAMSDEFKEICATHFRCISRCPQGVQISRIMNAIKQCAIEDGYSYPESLKALERT